MKEINMFEYAVRNKLRFPFKGLISTEDLFDLSLEELDSIYKILNKKMKIEEKEESLLNNNNNNNTSLSIQIDIIKYIVSSKLKEKEDKERKQAKMLKKQQIMSIIADKENKELQNTSVEELRKILDGLDEEE